MEAQKNIIAIRKQDMCKARLAFKDLMSKTEQIINEEARQRPIEYKKMSASDLEVCSLNTIKKASQGTPFREEQILLISGQRFPDIVAEQYYGVEIKCTKQDHWTSTGSSIVESTRDINVEDIYMLFGKLGGDIPQFMCKPYEDVLYDIAVTHSPRYLINMELNHEDTIFAKMGTTYNEFRKATDSIDKVRAYYRDKAIKAGRQEMPWWITNENAEQAHGFNIVLWNSLTADEKKVLRIKCMILFPEALSPKQSPTKYNQTTLWLCSYNQVVNPNIRDMYSAGGKITHVNGKRLATPLPQVFNHIITLAEDIKQELFLPSVDMMKMIAEFNPILLKRKSMFEAWLDQMQEYATPFNVDIREWISLKPIFEFSK